MPTFYFDTNINGTAARDDEGLALENIETAKHEAMAALYSLAQEIEPEIGSRCVVLNVRDDKDQSVFATSLVVTALNSRNQTLGAVSRCK